MAWVNLNKSEKFLTNTTAASKYIPNSFWKMRSEKGGYLYWCRFCASFGYVLWCCNSICQELFTFTQVGSCHSVIQLREYSKDLEYTHFIIVRQKVCVPEFKTNFLFFGIYTAWFFIWKLFELGSFHKLCLYFLAFFDKVRPYFALFM